MSPRFRRATLIHAGSGLWLHAALSPGNGNRRADLEAAADAVRATCARLHHPLDRALLVMDGEFAAFPTYAALRSRALPFISLYTRYEVLDLPEVRAKLAAASSVPSSGV